MSSDYPRGSEWRKWDLHVHVPGTKLADGYRVGYNDDLWDKFCDCIEQSDVAVFGITDYFSFDNYFIFLQKFKAKYPSSAKRFFPNAEIRLNESVNEEVEEVNVHLLFKSDITRDKADEFMRELKTEITDGNSRHLSCTDLTTGDHFKSAVVTRESIEKAFVETFGKKAVRQEHLLIITAANNDGIRPARGKSRKENITDEIDKLSDAYFGGSQNRDHFLKTNRLEDTNQTIKAKPVFCGSDAHSFQQFDDWVGKTVRDASTNKEITWVKSNPTIDGLLQTLIEPSERVSISSVRPDPKESYKIIESVKFSGSNDFPADEIVLNENLSSIIGSRSSGKSALLAYIAHAINPEETITRQLASQEGIREDEIGPAAGRSWSSVSQINCDVVWGSGSTGGGKVVYIPQNYLFSISNRPVEITQKIVPVLFKNFPDVKSQFEKTTSDIEAANLSIETALNRWFDNKATINKLRDDIAEVGSKAEIEKARDGYQTQIDGLKKQLSITDEDVQTYQQLTQAITQKESRRQEIGTERNAIAPFVAVAGEDIQVPNLNASVSFYPSIDSLPTKLNEKIVERATAAQNQISDEAKKQIINYYKALAVEETQLATDIVNIQKENSELIEKNKQNNQLAELVKSVNVQNAKLSLISEKEGAITEKTAQLAVQIKITNESLSKRTQTLTDLSSEFSALDQSGFEITFGVEFDYDRQTRQGLAEIFNRAFSSSYIVDERGGLIDMAAVKNDVVNFLTSLEAGTQKLKNGQDKRGAAKAILCATEEIRFTATLEEDKIGGFALSTMTPGKRALFALTLILSETEGGWPLLIDQPEDDLDSRSIYEQIVPYIMLRKKERQIVMVSHNANLVVGADSEQVVVANQHGDDRKNREGKTFAYLTGALEDSIPKHDAECVLESCGIREHACEILDGGEEAFEKRKDKYRL